MPLASVEELNTVIIYSKFGKDWSSGLDSVDSQILPVYIHLSIDHYNIACTTVHACRPGSRLGKVDLSRLGPLKSDQVGFRWRHRHIYQAQLKPVLWQVELKKKISSHLYVPANPCKVVVVLHSIIIYIYFIVLGFSKALHDSMV
jgi:hypothetical protein